jgi:hypothetical protein
MVRNRAAGCCSSPAAAVMRLENDSGAWTRAVDGIDIGEAVLPALRRTRGNSSTGALSTRPEAADLGRFPREPARERGRAAAAIRPAGQGAGARQLGFQPALRSSRRSSTAWF